MACCLPQLHKQRALLFLQIQPCQQLSLQREVCLLAQLHHQNGVLLALASLAESASRPADTARSTAFIAMRGVSIAQLHHQNGMLLALASLAETCACLADTATSTAFIARRGARHGPAEGLGNAWHRCSERARKAAWPSVASNTPLFFLQIQYCDEYGQWHSQSLYILEGIWLGQQTSAHDDVDGAADIECKLPQLTC